MAATIADSNPAAWLPRFAPETFVGQRRAVRAGPVVVSVDFDAAFDLSRIAWLEPPDAAADLTIQLRQSPTEAFAAVAPPRWSRDRQTRGVTLANERIQGTLRPADGTGALRCCPVAGSISLQGKVMADAFIAGVVALAQDRGGLALHASTLWLDGQAWVVAGASGRGKSTLARRFAGRHLHEEHAFVVPRSGRMGRGAWEVWRMPQFRGPYDRHLPYVAPLAGIVELGIDRSVTAARPLAPADRFAAVMRNAYLTADLPTLCASVERITSEVPVGTMSHHLQTPLEAVAATLQRLGDSAGRDPAQAPSDARSHRLAEERP